jgi:hypothetical protein
LITTALRGNAEDSKTTDEKPKSVPTSTASGKFFSRPALDFSIIGDNKAGAYVIRVGEIVEHPAILAFIKSQMFPDNLIPELWKQSFGPDVRAPKLQLDTIDYIAGIGNLTIRPLQPTKTAPGLTNTVMVGTAVTILHFKQPVAWKEWIHDYIPGAVKKSAGGVDYVELPVIKLLGPTPLCIAARDAQTVVLVAGNDELLTSAANPAPRPSKSQLAARWTELDGGLVTFIATDHDIKLGEPTTPDKKLAKQVFDASRLVGWGFDADARTHEAYFRAQLTCDNVAAAEQLQTTFQLLLKFGQAAMASANRAATDPTSPGRTANQSAQDREADRIGAEVISNCRAKVWQQPDGAAGILVESTANLPDFAAAGTIAREKTPAKTLSPK